MLGVILGRAELALEHAGEGTPLREDLEEIGSAARRSADLTRQLLAFARKQAVAPRVLDLNETAAGMLKMLRRLIGEDIELRWVPGEGLWPVEIDPSQLDQVLANLVVNARDAIGGVGRVTIETRTLRAGEEYCARHPGVLPGDYVLLAVTDTGCGMDPETQAHIFEPFFTTKGTGRGTGLGLATVYGIVKQNRGFIHVTSQPGQGTTFELYLPRHLGGALAALPAGAPAPARRGSETILLVEDEPAMLSVTARRLEAHGYQVLRAGGPREALDLAKAHGGAIDLLLTDVVMPGMNGRELADTLTPLRPGLKHLFMSGFTADVIGSRGVLGAGVRFLQKPFSSGDLASLVREALESGRE